MNKEVRYINIREALSRTLRHPLLQDVNLEQVVQYTIDFIGIFGLPQMYQHKEVTLKVDAFRCELPCDLISIELVKDCKSGISMRSMTDVFNPQRNHPYFGERRRFHELSFKTQGRTLFTSFEHGMISIAYLSVAVDETGLPMLIDDPIYMLALDAYIKREVFTILFDQGKLQPAVLQNAEKRYAYAAGRLGAHFKMPSLSEMESITRMWNQLIPRMHEFDRQFEALGNLEATKNGGDAPAVLDLIPATIKPEDTKPEDGDKVINTTEIVQNIEINEGGDDPTVENETLVWDDDKDN